MTEPTKLLPCPFCGGDARTDAHADDCYFMLHRKLNALPESDLSMHLEVLAAWNRRTPQPTQAQAGAVPLTDGQIDAAAKKLAECMEYPWEFMPEPGRKNMRKHAQDVIEAAHGIKGGQHG